MSRMKPERTDGSGRGKPVSLPAWWLAALNKRCDGKSNQQVADELNAVVHRDPPFRRETVGDFLNGKVTTDAMMAAFLVLFPDLLPPVFYANSYEEAIWFQQLAKLHARANLDKVDGRKVDDTIEDTGEQRASEKRQRTRERTARRTK